MSRSTIPPFGTLPVVVIVVLFDVPFALAFTPPTETGPCATATTSPLGARNCV